MRAARKLALAIPLAFVSVPVLAGTLIINNRSCLVVTDVTIDGAHQTGNIGAGATGTHLISTINAFMLCMGKLILI
jgi:hypothetical protein